MEISYDKSSNRENEAASPVTSISNNLNNLRLSEPKQDPPHNNLTNLRISEPKQDPPQNEGRVVMSSKFKCRRDWMSLMSDHAPTYEKTKKRFKFLSKAAKLSYSKELCELLEMGFTKLKKNLKYLRKFRGSVELAAAGLWRKQEEKFTKKLQYKDKKQKERKLNDRKHKHDHHHHDKHHHNKDHDHGEIIKKKCHKYLEHRRLSNRDFESIPAHIKTIYLDGNSLVFEENDIRRMLVDYKQSETEKSLASLLVKIITKSGKFDCVVVFDKAENVIEEMILCEGEPKKYMISSAQPEVENTAKMLVKFAVRDMKNLRNSLFVTGDAKVIKNLEENGVNQIMSPQNWFKVVQGILKE